MKIIDIIGYVLAIPIIIGGIIGGIAILPLLFASWAFGITPVFHFLGGPIP